jgi:hypothetical protein
MKGNISTDILECHFQVCIGIKDKPRGLGQYHLGDYNPPNPTRRTIVVEREKLDGEPTGDPA